MDRDKESETVCTWVLCRGIMYLCLVQISVHHPTAHTKLCGMPVLFSDSKL